MAMNEEWISRHVRFILNCTKDVSNFYEGCGWEEDDVEEEGREGHTKEAPSSSFTSSASTSSSSSSSPSHEPFAEDKAESKMDENERKDTDSAHIMNPFPTEQSTNTSLDVTPAPPMDNFDKVRLFYRKLPMSDSCDEYLFPHLMDAVDYIDLALSLPLPTSKDGDNCRIDPPPDQYGGT